MIDKTNAGRRVRMIGYLRTEPHIFQGGEEGTVLSETENLGRWMIIISWDKIGFIPAFPHEIAYIPEAEVAHNLDGIVAGGCAHGNYSDSR